MATYLEAFIFPGGALPVPTSAPLPIQIPLPPAAAKARQRGARLRLFGAGILIVLTTFLCERADLLIRRPYGSFATELAQMQAVFRFYVVLVGAFCVAWLSQPAVAEFLARATATLPAKTRKTFTAAALFAACLGLAIFVVHFGRQQYGGWDYNILVEVGWRQVLGQRPYVDFLTPTPPLFNWGAALAFRLFGVNWDANLYLTAIFGALTLLWSFALLRQLGMHRPAALGTSLVVQIATLGTCCFWWYNNTTLLLAGLFFMAALLLARSPDSQLAQTSYVALFALLPLTKPNIAGPTLLGCTILLSVAAHARRRILFLTLAAAALSILLMAAFHLPFAALMSTYREVAKERGGFSIFGFKELMGGERRLTVLWIGALCLPLSAAWKPFREALRLRSWSRAAFWLLFPLAAVVTVLGVAGNGEQRDVDTPLLVVAIALLSFTLTTHKPKWQRFTVALLCAMAASDLYTGAARLRVFTMGQDKFFAWHDNQHLVGPGFLAHLRGSRALVDVDAELRHALDGSPGPVFLGPRVDFEYAGLGITSPTHWASFFQPGTAFGRDQSPALLSSWGAHHFRTLVFLKDDYTFYPPELLDTIGRLYLRDDRLPLLTVYRRRPGL